MDLISLAGHGHKSGSKYVCLIIARVTKVTKVAQPKLEALRPQVCLCWTVPARVKANRKLMPIRILRCWILRKAASSTIFWVFRMTTRDWSTISWPRAKKKKQKQKQKNKTKTTPPQKKQRLHKNVNINLHWIWFRNLYARNKRRLIEMPLKSINQTKISNMNKNQKRGFLGMRKIALNS